MLETVFGGSNAEISTSTAPSVKEIGEGDSPTIESYWVDDDKAVSCGEPGSSDWTALSIGRPNNSNAVPAVHNWSKEHPAAAIGLRSAAMNGVLWLFQSSVARAVP